jgi:hypothetical protein
VKKPEGGSLKRAAHPLRAMAGHLATHPVAMLPPLRGSVQVLTPAPFLDAVVALPHLDPRERAPALVR